jgi:hypothetical protein
MVVEWIGICQPVRGFGVERRLSEGGIGSEGAQSWVVVVVMVAVCLRTGREDDDREERGWYWKGAEGIDMWTRAPLYAISPSTYWSSSI